VFNDPVNYVDTTGYGKVKYFIKVVRGLYNVWRPVSKNQARRALKNGGNVLVKGRGSSKEAKRLAREVFGNKTVRHDGHVLPQMESRECHIIRKQAVMVGTYFITL